MLQYNSHIIHSQKRFDIWAKINGSFQMLNYYNKSKYIGNWFAKKFYELTVRFNIKQKNVSMKLICWHKKNDLAAVIYELHIFITLLQQ